MAANRNIVIAVVAVLVLIAVVLVVASHKKSGGSASSGSGEIFLQAAADPGADPFTDSVAAPTPSSTVPLATPVALGTSSATTPDLRPPTTGASQASGTGAATTPTLAFSGGAPGLYGGTRNKASCDIEKLATFLADNPDKASAWAEAQGIPVADVPSFVRGLTPVVLRADTRVTNFGYRGGHPTAHQAILQAGTAVLVDKYGEPQAKCNCGNPLNPPQAVPTAPVYTGPKWPGFTPAAVTIVQPSTTVINIITIIDITTGTPFGRPTGPTPGTDTGLPGSGPGTGGNPGSGSSSSTTSTTATTTTTTAPTSGGGVLGISPGGSECTGKLTGVYLESRMISSTDTQPTTFDQPNAPGCYRMVISGEVDMNTNNSYSGGFDPVWCTDPQYCSQPMATVKLTEGKPLWEAWGFGTPPPLDPSHTYTFVIKVQNVGGFSIGLTDDAYDDNRGSWKVDLYG